MIERFLRAAGAILAGFSIAWEHLTDRDDPFVCAATPHVEQQCPACGTSLTPGPHIHDGMIVWATDRDGDVLVTDMRGGDAAVFHAGGDL